MRRYRPLAIALVVAIARPVAAAPPSEIDACADASEKGQLLRIQGKLLDARAQFLACVRDVCPALVKKDCAQFLVDLEAATPTIVIAARDTAGNDLADVRVLVDGKPFLERLEGKAIAMDPGVRTFRFEAAGKLPLERTVVVREGERARVVTVTLRGVDEGAPNDDRGLPTGFFVATGLGVVSLGAFAIFGLSARADFDRLQTTCGTRCGDDDVDRVKRKALFADVALGASIVSLGVATWLFVDHARRPKVEVAALPGGAFVGLSGAF